MSDVDSSLHFGHVCLQLPSEFLLGKPVNVSLLPLHFLYPLCFFSFTSLAACVLSDFTWWENRAESYETPTLPWLFLSVISPRIIIWKSTPQLSHFPGIWQSWNARRSRLGWALQSPSWSIFPPKCHLSCSWQANAATEETSEGLLNTKPPSSAAEAAAV